MVIHFTNIYNNVVFPGKKAYIFGFKGRKSCVNGDSVTLEFEEDSYPMDAMFVFGDIVIANSISRFIIVT